MLKWVSGAKAGKPPKKRPAESEDDLSKSQRIQESKRKYETTRKREYKHSWEKGRPWLSYSGSKMWCAACSGAGLSNAFTSGVSTMKLDSIQSHELSKAHLRSMTAFNAECKGVPEETPASYFTKTEGGCTSWYQISKRTRRCKTSVIICIISHSVWAWPSKGPRCGFFISQRQSLPWLHWIHCAGCKWQNRKNIEGVKIL